MQRCGIIGVRGLEGQTRGLIFAVLRGSLIFEALCYCPLQATWDIPGVSLLPACCFPHFCESEREGLKK